MTEPDANSTHQGPSVILGPDGPIAASLPNYEVRPQQLTMADAVATFKKVFTDEEATEILKLLDHKAGAEKLGAVPVDHLAF